MSQHTNGDAKVNFKLFHVPFGCHPEKLVKTYLDDKTKQKWMRTKEKRLSRPNKKKKNCKKKLFFFCTNFINIRESHLQVKYKIVKVFFLYAVMEPYNVWMLQFSAYSSLSFQLLEVYTERYTCLECNFVFCCGG